MVTNPNFFGQSTTGTPNQIEDGVDFPHTGLIKTLALGMKQNYVMSGFDITPSSETAGTVSTGVIMRDGEVITIDSGSPPYAITLDATYTNGYHLLVVDSTNTVVVRNPASPTIGADKVPAYVDGDVIIAILTHTGINPFSIQYLTVNKTKNSLSIGEGSGTYSEEMSITSDGTDVTFTSSTNTNMDFTPSGSGRVRITTGDLEVQNGNFEVPNGYSELTVVKSVTDGGGAGLSAGAPVYPTNYASGKITVQLADATIAASKYPAIGLIYDAIPAGGNGKVVVQGLTGDISATLFDAGSYSEGDIIYLSPNIGKLTNTRPTANTDAIQNIGRIVHLSTFTAGSSGTAKILVQGSGRSNDVTNDGFVTTNASSIPTARQITAGDDISFTDGGAGSTLTIDNTSTLDSVTTRNNTTTNGINVAYLGGEAIVPSASMGSADDLYYFINGAAITLPFAALAAKRLLHFKNVFNGPAIISTQAGEYFDPSPIHPTGIPSNPDQRVLATNQIVLEEGESIVLTALTDSVSPLVTGYYVLDLDTGGSETDPVFSASPAASITNAGSGDVSQGDTAFGWGDHAGLYATAAQGATADTALQTVAVDGTTITGDGTALNPLSAVGGGGTPSGGAGAIQFSDGTAFDDDGANLYWDDGNNRLGVGTNTPTNALHVKTTVSDGDEAYAARFQAYEGNVGVTRYGGIHISNDNSTPIDGAEWDTNRWQIGQRDGNQLDFSYGSPTNTNIPASDTDLRITATGDVGIGLGATDPSAKLHVNGTIRQTNATNAHLVADANGDLVAGVSTGQYQRFILDNPITGISGGTTTPIPFSATSGSAAMYGLYASPTDFAIGPTLDRLIINTNGLYQFTFGAFLAAFSTGTVDYRITISTSPTYGGDILSFRNRTGFIDRYTGSGVATVYLTAFTEVFFSVFCNVNYEVGGVVLPSETRTFVDVRRLE